MHLDVYANWLMCSYMIMLTLIGTSKGQRAFFFCLGYFSLSKKFNYVAKDAKILHLKSNNNNRPSYFPTSTLLQTHPPSPWLTSCRRSIVEMKFFWHLICANLTSFKFFVFYYHATSHFFNILLMPFHMLQLHLSPKICTPFLFFKL
jgi:hypothetical protein